MVHSVSAGEQTFIVKGFLVVEVALYPPPGAIVDVHSGNFVLRVNGKKQELLPQSPSMVAAFEEHPGWSNQRRLDAEAGAGPVSIGTAGSPSPGSPFPAPGRPPQVPRANPSGVPSREPLDAARVVRDTALPQGEHRGPVSGFLYFPYTGRISSIKSLELRYEDAILRLR